LHHVQELSISLVAAVPALAISWGLLAGLYKWVWMPPDSPGAVKVSQ